MKSVAKLTVLIVALIIAYFIMKGQIWQYSSGKDTISEVTTRVKQAEESYQKSLDEKLKAIDNRKN